MKFLKIEIEGFRSFASATLAFKNSGVCFVQGKNGAGKSTLFEALYFAIYGNAVKNSNLSDLVTLKKYRPENFKGTLVRLQLVVGMSQYIIERTMDYQTNAKDKMTALLVYKDGELLPFKDKAETQLYLNKLVGLPSEVFLQSTFFAQKSLRIIDSKDAEKRDLLEMLFDIDVSNYASKASTKISELRAEVASLQSTYAQNATKSEMLKSKYASDRTILDEFESNKQSTLATSIASLTALKDELANLETDLPEIIETPYDYTEYNRLQKELSLKTGLVSTLHHQFDSYTATKQQLENSVLDVTCSTCGQLLPEDKKKEIFASRDAKIQQAVKSIETVSSNLEEEKKRLEELKALFAIENTKVQAHQVALNSQAELKLKHQAVNNARTILQTKIQEQEKHINYVREMTCPVTDDSLKNIADEWAALDKANDEISSSMQFKNSQIEKYNYWATVGFTDKGLKAYLFQAMTAELNKSLRKYGEKLGILVEFSVKIETKSKAISVSITTPDGVARKYSDLSGGEQKRVDVIVSFALHDLISSKGPAPSVMVLDEIFEGLDEVGLDVAIQLIRIKAESVGVYIISHHINIDITNSEVLRIEKKNNLSQIVN